MEPALSTVSDKRLMWVLWPAFLLACAGELVLFAFVDPTDLRIHGMPLELSREGIYTVAFFALWAMAAGSSALTVFLAASPFEINRCPLPPMERPDGCPKQECGVLRSDLDAS